MQIKKLLSYNFMPPFPSLLYQHRFIFSETNYIYLIRGNSRLEEAEKFGSQTTRKTESGKAEQKGCYSVL